MKPHEVRPNVKKEKKSKMQGEKGTYLILRLRGLVRNKGACPISRCKKEKKQAQNGSPQRALCRSLCAVRRSLPRAHRDSCSNNILCPKLGTPTAKTRKGDLVKSIPPLKNFRQHCLYRLFRVSGVAAQSFRQIFETAMQQIAHGHVLAAFGPNHAEHIPAVGAGNT